MTILRSGTSKKYSENWGAAFGEKKKKAKPAAGKAKVKAGAKKTKKKAKKK